MPRPSFKIIPASITLILCVVLLGLGLWQLQRAAWKHNLIASYNAQINKEPLVALPPPDESGAAIYQRVVLGGKYMHHYSVQLRPRSADGTQGYDLVTPLALYTGEVVLVLRGFVPDVTKDSIDQPTGTVAVTGMLRAFSPQGWRPDNAPDADQWYWVDPAALARKYGFADPYPLLLVSEDRPLNTPWPLPAPGAPDFKDFHLLYAGIWFSLAIILLVIYFRSTGSRKK